MHNHIRNKHVRPIQRSCRNFAIIFFQTVDNPYLEVHFRLNFSPDRFESIIFLKDRSSVITKLIFNQPTSESTTGNQILLTTDEPTRTLKVPTSPTTTTTTAAASLLPTRPRSGTSVADDSHV